MQLRHRRAEQRLGLGLHRLVEPGIQRSRKLASHHNRRIKLNSRVATKSFKEDGRGRAAESLLDRGERLVVELDRGKRLSAFGFGCSDLCITPRYSRNLTRRWRRFQRRRTGVHRISLRQRRLIVMGRGLLGHLELAVARSFGGWFLRWCGFSRCACLAIADAPNASAAILGYEQRTVLPNGNTDRTSPCFFV